MRRQSDDAASLLHRPIPPFAAALRHRLNRRAISLFPLLSAASKTMRLRSATCTAAVRRRDSFSNTIRFPEPSSIAGATRISSHGAEPLGDAVGSIPLRFLPQQVQMLTCARMQPQQAWQNRSSADQYATYLPFFMRGRIVKPY
jgi:hypothetical protein